MNTSSDKNVSIQQNIIRYDVRVALIKQIKTKGIKR